MLRQWVGSGLGSGDAHHPDGWTAEIRIPLNQLRYSADSLQTWGLQLRRYIQRNHEEDDWSFWGKTEAGGAPRFGHLQGLEIAHSSRHLELLPYVSSTARSLEADKHDPFNHGVQPSARVGADIKYLLTSNLTLDATINPDFGQVEVDPAVVNLSAFETSFSEKRPFFIEGSGVFDFGSFNCFFCSNVSSLNAFYSRRIGRAPDRCRTRARRRKIRGSTRCVDHSWCRKNYRTDE